MTWIKVTTRLPDWEREHARSVIVTNNASVWMCDMNPIYWYRHRGTREYEITHWMEKPEPPKADGSTGDSGA